MATAQTYSLMETSMLANISTEIQTATVSIDGRVVIPMLESLRTA